MENDEYYQQKLEEFARDEAYDDAMASECYQEQMNEIKSEGIDEFQRERLQEYYLSNDKLPQSIQEHINRAKKIIDANFSEAGFVFSYTAIEIILKSVFLKPLLNGSFIYQHIADLVVEKILQTKNDSFQKILFRVLKYSASFDFATYKRPRVKITLWDEIMNAKKQRNKIIHEGEIVDLDKAKNVYRIVLHLNKIIFPKILDNVELKIVAKKIDLK